MTPNGSETTSTDERYAARRRRMVQRQLERRGIDDRRVLDAMAAVPRERFVEEADRDRAYRDGALRIGEGQTISQPWIVACMAMLLELEGHEKVLEVGTGSGYHAAVLSRIAREVYSIEIVETVASQASKRLSVLGYHNIEVRVGDGYQGWADQGPFDAILLPAAPPHIPKPLVNQLKVGGRMVVPVGGFFQDLLVITKTADGLEKRTVIPVRLVPMTGKVRDGEK